MASKHLPSLAAASFAAMLFHFLSKRRSRAINGGEANNNAAATESHGMGTSSGYDYEVFLSFRGTDTRSTFTSHLYNRLKDSRIRTFKDDEELRTGEEFAPALLQAIKQSKILVPIFSKNYATSVWCLKEVAQMVECKKTGGQKIMPIFYDVAPSEVRHQSGKYGKAFRSHEKNKRYDKETIHKWKAALEEVSSLSGGNPQSMPNGGEGEFVRKFTEEIWNELKKALLPVPDCLIGIDDHVDKIMAMIGAPTREITETRIIVIHGMGGIGKTTIAKVLYNGLSKHFGNCCYLSNIREESKNPRGIVRLQRQLISDILKRRETNIRNREDGTETIRERLSEKKVLLLLDDVDNPDDMDELVGKRDFPFGKGSVLIITTRNKEVLNGRGVQDLYEVNVMDPEQSLQLFRRRAFEGDYRLNENIDQSEKAVKIAGGLPLALEAIGSFLAPNMGRWDARLKLLEKYPHERVMSNLKISYEALKEDDEKRIFCDIACLFNGCDKDILLHFWGSRRSRFCSVRTMYVLDVLGNKSLIKIEEDKKVLMHVQLEYLGRDICGESNGDVKKRKRVWDPEDVLKLLGKREGNTKVETLRLKFDPNEPYCFTCEDFRRLSNLEFLEVEGSSGLITVQKRLLRDPFSLHNFRKKSLLLPQIRWLSWHDILSEFDISSFSIQNVIILDLSRSKIKHDWQGWSHVKRMEKLKVLDLTGCDSLSKTPIFSADSNLERLILARCTSLTEIHKSICQLKCLVSLDVSYCNRLWSLPDEWGTDLASLKYLSLKHCESLKSLPKSIENLKELIELDISNTGVEELPDTLWTMGKLERIKAVTINGVERFQVNIGDCIYSNTSLKILRLRCVKIYTLPKLPQSLVELQLSGLCMDTFPNLSYLTDLKDLGLRFGSLDSDGRSDGLVEYPMPRWIGDLTKLESLSLSFRCVDTSPADLGLPPQLKSLTLACPNLNRLPRLPSRLLSLHLKRCESLCSMGDLSNLTNLFTLQIDGAAITDGEVLGRLEKLRDLRLLGLGQVLALPDLRNLKKLRIIHVIRCGKLVEIQGELPESLVELYIRSCNDLREVPGLSSLRRQQKVETVDCEKLP